MGTFVFLFVVAFFSAIPLNVLARVLGDENARWEGGKSIMTMYVCVALAFAVLRFFAHPYPEGHRYHLDFGFLPLIVGWLLIVFGVVFTVYGLGAKRTFWIALPTAVITPLVGLLFSSLLNS